jgi:hypothetical protein
MDWPGRVRQAKEAMVALAVLKAAAAAALGRWASLALPHLAVMHWRLAAMESHHLSQGLLLREPVVAALAATP